MGSVDSAKKLTQTVQNSKYTTTDNKEINRIHVSTLCPNSSKEFDSDSYAYKLAQLSGGIAVSNYNAATETEVQDITSETVNVLASKAKSSKTSVSVSTNLIQILGEGNTSKYKVINSAGLNTINLKQKLTKGSAEDYDKDGITDWNEVNTRLIYSILARDSSSNVYSEGTIAPGSLPTFADCRWYYSNSEEPKFYVEQGYEQFVNKNAAMYYNGDKEKVKEKLNKIRILPLISDPTKPDSDGDGILDCLNNDFKHKTEFADPNPLKYEYLWQWPVVSADAVEEVNGRLQSKVDKNGDKLVFKDEYKCKNLQASFVEKRPNNKYHNAIDITTKTTDVFYVIAAYNGYVTKTYNNCPHISSNNKYSTDYRKCNCNTGTGYGDYGNCIEITSNINGVDYTTIYGHLKLKSLCVSEKSYVYAGDIIATVGSSGSSDGPHLDFSIRKIQKNGGNSVKTVFDPILYYVYSAPNVPEELTADNDLHMYINIPKNLTKSCGSPSDGCTNYYPYIEKKYKITMKELT